ncbi:MAG: response regulator transcription factor [Tannerella sp.]|nr:response regulator transcription factor [Tannerella sp.]
MQHKLLIVDDEPDILEVLEFNLANEGFEITCAVSAEEALLKLTSEHSLILLDVMLAGMSGYKLAESLRRKSNQIPIIFITAKDTENDMLTGFSVGGDDYISKPFSIKEVVARVKAVLKRQQKPDKFVQNDFILDFNLKELTIAMAKVELTKTEYRVLSILVQRQGRVISRDEMISEIWKETPYITERTVDVHIARLRKKLGAYSSIITNQPGFGYRFNIDAL